MLPLSVAVASFVLQTHVATFPLVAVTGALMAAAIGRRWIGASAEERAVLTTQANRAAWVLAALWFLPLAEELSRPGGNLSAMWQFARRPPHGGTFTQAFDAWAGALTGVFRAALPLPQGRLIGGAMVVWPRLFAVLQLRSGRRRRVGAGPDGVSRVDGRAVAGGERGGMAAARASRRDP